MTNRLRFRCFFALLIGSFAGSLFSYGHTATAVQQLTLEELEARLQKEYTVIEDRFAHGPAKLVYPPDPRRRLREWQDDLAQSFVKAGATIEKILALHPPSEDAWRERRETMLLYSQPTSSPESRMVLASERGIAAVFGATEVEKKARLLTAPPAAYPDRARAAKAGGEVRLRLVLAADGTVKYIFPMKPLKYGLTEAAIEAAKQIKFEPAIRKGQTVSQFATLSYEFKKGRGLPPYFPEHEFYF